jgi:hydrogenase small subunit
VGLVAKDNLNGKFEMPKTELTILESLLNQGISRRSFLKFCAVTASMLALPASERFLFSRALATASRPSVIWLHFQECTACTESITRSFEPTLENLILNMISLDYHETLMVAAGHNAEHSLDEAKATGGHILIVEGSLSERDGWCTIGNKNSTRHLQEAMAKAELVIAVGSCAAYGGLPKAYPNPSDAISVGELMEQGKVPRKPLVNLPGCPPVPEVITGSIVHYLAYGSAPEMDEYRRPLSFYGKTVHDRCPRKGSYNAGKFAESFDDEGARKGWCLLHLGCKGPETYNACSVIGWNGRTSSPMHSGHGCIGCSQPDFWDRWGTDGGVYTNLEERNRPPGQQQHKHGKHQS